jgi:hypothetical protein
MCPNTKGFDEMRYIAVLMLTCFLITGCLVKIAEKSKSTPIPTATPTPVHVPTKDLSTDGVTMAVTPTIQPISLIDAEGDTLKERFLLPDGYIRVESKDGSFAAYLQNLPLKPDGTRVKYFDGREKNRDVYMAVVDYPLGDRDLQQCADAVMRLRAEYLYAASQQDKINFNFVNGFAAEFSKWASGYGISVNNNNVSWIRNTRNDSSYESFQRYLDIVYAYSSTLSLEKELIPKDITEIAIGDVFIIGGSPGHCVIVADMAVNENSGEKIFLLAQSYMPAQDIQILKGTEEGSPWYSASISDKLLTPEWTFDQTQLKTWP